MDIIGKKFEIDFGAKAVLTFYITEKDGEKVDEFEVVEISIARSGRKSLC